MVTISGTDASPVLNIDNTLTVPVPAGVAPKAAAKAVRSALKAEQTHPTGAGVAGLVSRAMQATGRSSRTREGALAGVKRQAFA